MTRDRTPGYANDKVLYKWPSGSHYHKSQFCPAVPEWHGEPAGFLQGPYNDPDSDIRDKQKCKRCWGIW